MRHRQALYLAQVQDGMITRQQAKATGMSDDAIRHAIRHGGPWRRVLPGIYATFNGPLAEIHRLRTTILHAGDGALVTGAWACDMSGLRYGPSLADHIDVVVPPGSRRRSLGFVRIVRTTRMPAAARFITEERLADLRGSGPPLDVVLDELAPSASPGVIPMVPSARAVADTVVRPQHSPPDWRPTCVEPRRCAQCRRGRPHGETALANVRALCAKWSNAAGPPSQSSAVRSRERRGALARPVMNDIEAGCRSAPECELRDLVARSRVLPEPQWNQPLPGRVLPVSPTRIRTDATAVLREIEAAYRAGTPLINLSSLRERGQAQLGARRQ